MAFLANRIVFFLAELLINFNYYAEKEQLN